MFRKLKNNNTGAFTNWQKGWMLLVLFFVFTFAIDICILALELVTESHQLSYLAEKLSFQGGFVGTNSQNSSSTWNNQEIYNYLSRSLIRFGVDGDKLHFSLVVCEPDGNKHSVIDTSRGIKPAVGYYSRNFPVSGSNTLANTYAGAASIELSFDNKLFFSSRVFPFLTPVRTYTLTERYVNLFISA